MIPLALILLRRRSDVPGTGANHLVGLILLDAMTNPSNRSSQGERELLRRLPANAAHGQA
jgi:hypothetical protein